MKRIFLSLVLFLGVLSLVNAQENAIGLKFGYGVDLSYQQALSGANRLELNLGLDSFDNNAPIIFSGAYQWVWDLSDKLAPGFKWYAGAGAMVGLANSEFYLWAIGNVGIEYNFHEVPVQLSLDWTPAFRITPSHGDVFGADGVRLAVRYKF